MKPRRFPQFTKTCALIIALTCTLASGAAVAARAPQKSRPTKSNKSNVASPIVTFDLRDFGAIGDGISDDGPALQSALDALADAGGGTLVVPEGHYAIVTPVAKDFGGLDSSVTIEGVESLTPVPPPTASGNELTQGLDLVSEFLPRTGNQQIAIRLAGLRSVLVKDIAFVGTPDVLTDAFTTLAFYDVGEAVVRHCEFYGLSSLEEGGSIVGAVRSGLKIEQSEFLGCAADSGVYGSVVDNLEWKSIAVTDTVFTDYGQRPELFGKLGIAAPYSWIAIGNAAAVTAASPRREAVVRNVFLDEGALAGISSLPERYQPPSAPIDLLYVSGLWMNVSNLGTSGHYLTGLQGVLVENSHFGWSYNADVAINILGARSAILDRVECVDDADTIRADAATSRLAVIDSTYATLDSLAPDTRVINTTAPDEDPVQYVRAQFESALGREPDAAAHFYWSDRILACGDDSQCVAASRAALSAYLAAAPQPSFALTGLITDEDGAPLAGVAVSLSGSQTVTAETDAEGFYRFDGLPTSGVYTIAAEKLHYNFVPQAQTFVTPGADVRADFAAALNRHSIGGRLATPSSAGIAGVTMSLSGSQPATTTTDANGNFFFGDLPAGGDYTVTPSSERYVFAPLSKDFDDLDGDKSVSFGGTPLFHTIGGRVFNSNNYGIEGIAVSLSGSQTRATVTDANGNFSFADTPRGGDYTVTPSLNNYVFSPASKTFDDITADQWADFGIAPAPTSTPTPTPSPTPTPTPATAVVQFSAVTFNVSEGGGSFQITLTRTGDVSNEASVTYSAQDGTAQQGDDLSTALGLVVFAPGETTKTITLFITDDSFVESAESITLTLQAEGATTIGAQATATLTIGDNDSNVAGANPVDDARFFVRQHYRDFLNREPDASGLDFWAGQIAACGADAACLAVRRQNVSAAFFLSIEFKETGYLVYRLYKASYGRMPRRAEEFLFDSRIIGDGVEVNAPGWEQKLEANKSDLLAHFVARVAFRKQYPSSLTPAQFVAALNANTGGALTTEETATAVAEFGGAADSADEGARIRALLRVAESRAFYDRETNTAFVLMQYFGYLQRNPDDAPDDGRLIGFNFWLKKLNDFGGDFAKADMVRAFIESSEYRGRFGK
ncbi:MAG: carboxypeptidase regulatory-like domain-containing protein [Rubrivivax sp.]|nr:carboxypeptidase regulatory-like domain-containing protein [Pyrinomonadaceae bacterium]